MTEPADETPEPAHRLRQMACLPLIFDGSRWLVEEDPVVRLDLSGEVVCEHEGHVLNPRERAECALLKERARGALEPSRRDVADAFERAATHSGRFLGVG